MVAPRNAARVHRRADALCELLRYRGHLLSPAQWAWMVDPANDHPCVSDRRWALSQLLECRGHRLPPAAWAWMTSPDRTRAEIDGRDLALNGLLRRLGHMHVGSPFLPLPSSLQNYPGTGTKSYCFVVIGIFVLTTYCCAFPPFFPDD